MQIDECAHKLSGQARFSAFKRLSIAQLHFEVEDERHHDAEKDERDDGQRIDNFSELLQVNHQGSHRKRRHCDHQVDQALDAHGAEHATDADVF